MCEYLSQGLITSHDYLCQESYVNLITVDKLNLGVYDQFINLMKNTLSNPFSYCHLSDRINWKPQVLDTNKADPDRIIIELSDFNMMGIDNRILNSIDLDIVNEIKRTNLQSISIGALSSTITGEGVFPISLLAKEVLSKEMILYTNKIFTLTGICFYLFNLLHKLFDIKCSALIERMFELQNTKDSVDKERALERFADRFFTFRCYQDCVTFIRFYNIVFCRERSDVQPIETIGIWCPREYISCAASRAARLYDNKTRLPPRNMSHLDLYVELTMRPQLEETYGFVYRDPVGEVAMKLKRSVMFILFFDCFSPEKINTFNQLVFAYGKQSF